MRTPDHLIDAETASLAAALGSHYELVRLIGRGGMGRVYLAREPFLDRQVAVKVLPADIADAGDARERFLREARTAARLSHPNIVTLHTFGQAGDLLFFVMSYIQGESLEARLRREGRLQPEDARRILAELADALDYAHRAGVVHRDLKPDNVMIDATTGRAMLTDFGIAKQSAGRETLTQTGMLIGTPHYMSPEQAAGDRALDGRSDLYSLGVLGYRMLSGRLPFEGERVQDVLTQHITRAAVPLEEIVPGLPPELGTAVSRALAKDPAERWASGQQMRDSLTGESEELMPDDLRMLADQGTNFLAIGAAMGGLAYLLGIYGLMDPLACAIVGATGMVAPAIGFFSTLRARRQYGVRAVMSLWLRQPTWWSGAWPRIGRRAGDVWDRLPLSLRAMRQHQVKWLPVGLPVLAAFLYVMRPSFWVLHQTAVSAIVIPGAVLAVGQFSYQVARIRKWARENGLSYVDAGRVLSEPTFSRGFWSRPDIARLLAPVGAVHPVLVTPPAAPQSILRELDQLAASDSSSAHSDLFRDAAQAGRIVIDEMGHCDAELARLAGDANPHERARIQASLDALGAPAAHERAGKQEVRALLLRQLELFSELEARQAELRERRERLLEHLRMLGLQVAHLRAKAAEHPHDTAEVTGRIRALCRGIDSRIDGIAAVEGLLKDGGTRPLE